MFALVAFNDLGNIEEIIPFGTERFADKRSLPVGVELNPGVWHTVLALTEGAILLEMKAGPFQETAAKELAPWSPEDGTFEAVQYVKNLQEAIAEWRKIN